MEAPTLKARVVQSFLGSAEIVLTMVPTHCFHPQSEAILTNVFNKKFQLFPTLYLRFPQDIYFNIDWILPHTLQLSQARVGHQGTSNKMNLDIIKFPGKKVSYLAILLCREFLKVWEITSIRFLKTIPFQSWKTRVLLVCMTRNN